MTWLNGPLGFFEITPPISKTISSIKMPLESTAVPEPNRCYQHRFGSGTVVDHYGILIIIPIIYWKILHISSKNSTSETQDRVYHHPLIITLSLFLFLQSKSMDNEHDINRLLISLTANYKSYSNITISSAWLCLFCKFIYINTSVFKQNCHKINKFSNSKIVKPRYNFFLCLVK